MGRGEYRTNDMLSSKWRDMNLKVRKFNGIYSQKWQTRRSGQSDAMIEREAEEQYREEFNVPFSLQRINHIEFLLLRICKLNHLGITVKIEAGIVILKNSGSLITQINFNVLSYHQQLLQFVMESKKKAVEEKNKNQEEKVKIVNWEDFQHELARLSSLSSALKEVNHNKSLIQEKLNSQLQVGLSSTLFVYYPIYRSYCDCWMLSVFAKLIAQSEAESLSWSNQLDEMREKLEARKLVMGNMSMNLKVVQEKAKKQEDQLNSEIRSLLMAGTSLSIASRSLQEENNSLAGDRGYARLKNVQKLLRARQQLMVFQVSLLYPVKVVTGHTSEQELESLSNSSKAGNASGSKPLDAGSLTISGLHLTVRPFKKMSFFTDKKEVQSSATALGYVGHAVSLIAFYLEIPLRYPLRLGGSRTYICDYAPSVEPTSSDFTSISLPSSSSKPMEFPLFLEGQDTTRSAYAVFLLNKDLEQLLNFIGVESLGPRHVLANLKELLKNILSPEYINL
ncbi:hypothetical protein E3N88_16606 [Mikania micrantha]|uniref:Uncharacterized protein n=1 Tax=Mikania micrantha TaxID=192012 RepID=A0A5N6P1H6_9ASTR|nr:hypothetical protein E3N88_16606 [Mikania micrantha]